MALPQTLHGQLFLLAYDRRRQTFDGDKRWCFGLALRAAMLSDLYLTGHLEGAEDDEGTRYPVGVTSAVGAAAPSAGHHSHRWSCAAR